MIIEEMLQLMLAGGGANTIYIREPHIVSMYSSTNGGTIIQVSTGTNHHVTDSVSQIKKMILSRREANRTEEKFNAAKD